MNKYYKSKSQFRLALENFTRNRWGLVCLIILSLLYLSAIFAGFLSPYRYDSEDRKMVEYRTYILSPQELATFVLRTDKESFYEVQTDVDSIVQSFKWNRNFRF